MEELEPPYHVLIADDHQLIIDGLKSILSDHPEFKVMAEVSNGMEALAVLENPEVEINILLTDISMPEMSGVELCRVVKQKYPNVKVIMLSMYSKPAIIRECISAEADGFLLKSAGRYELFNALHRLVHHSTYFSQEVMPMILGQMEKAKTSEHELRCITAREREILKLIVEELTSVEIAQRLFISKKTVDNHRAHLLEKTGCRSTIGLVKFALQKGI